jgi:hypothetical protein
MTAIMEAQVSDYGALLTVRLADGRVLKITPKELLRAAEEQTSSTSR